MTNIKDSRSVTDTREMLSSFDIRTNPFTQNISGEHAYKRTERIVSALYLVTNHVPYDEPLRQNIRSIGHDLLHEVLALRGGFRSVGHERVNSIIARIRELASYIQLLCVAGYLSKQNASILIQAVDELGQFLSSSQRSILSEELSLSRDDFIPQAGPATRRAPRQPAAESARQPQHAAASDSPRPAATSSKGHSSTKGQEERAKRQAELHDERRKHILDILRSGGALGIKDITSNIVGCGEKTVQRELNALMQEGHVRKEGEKRWSRYSLVS